MTILVIDIGSSSIRTLLFDDEARLIDDAHASRNHQFATDSSGASVADVEALQRLTEMCIDEIMDHPAAKDIRAVGMATFVGNLLGVDERGKAITPVFTYADSRSAADVETLKTLVDAEAVHQRTGCLLHTAYHPARLRWLQRTQPDTSERIAQWTDAGTYYYRQWFGDANCSYSVASWSGLLNHQSLTWDTDWLETLGVSDDQFPKLADFTAARRGLLPEYTRRWNALANAPFYLAVGDGAAANIGSGAIDAGAMALTVGTTAALRVVTDTPSSAVPDGLWRYRVDADRYLTGGATSEGGNIFQWAKATLAVSGIDIEAELGQRKADAHGLTALPLLAGERSPGWQANATGSVIGLRLSTTPVDIVQALMEGVALRLALIADQLTDEAVQVMASGGALSASPAWTQMIANALNRPLHVIETTETTARGVAIMVLSALDKRSYDDFPALATHIIEPQAEAVAALKTARKRQESLYRTMISG